MEEPKCLCSHSIASSWHADNAADADAADAAAENVAHLRVM